jgi:predicted acylesterase/phospholipase RssA
MEGFGIFEGGGVRGLAHIGALKATEEWKVNFIGVAGTSAGAIAAALVAVGYRADELYKYHTSEGIFNDYFEQIFDQTEWNRFQTLKQDFEQTFSRISLFNAWINAPLFYLKCHKRTPVTA